MAQAPISMEDWRVQRYLHWLCSAPNEREPSTKSELAEELGINRRTLANWQDNVEFLKTWEKLYLKTIGDPGVKLRIMKTLEGTATDRDDPKHVQAAKTYMEIEGSMKPQRMEVSVTKDTAKLNDDELDAMIAAHAQVEAARRQTQ